jgi:membrane-bound inhibitor of C-type lysozyme
MMRRIAPAYRAQAGAALAVALLIVVILLIIAGILLWQSKKGPVQNIPASAQPVAAALYRCDGAKTITASFYDGASTPGKNGGPPTPGGSVALTLSDGRTMTLPQTISGSGVRYANDGESIVFWNEGNGAFITENNQQTYANCIAIAPDPGGLPQTYENGAEGFSIRYPSGYSVDDAYTYQEMGPGKDIAGVKFTIASSTAAGTNLGGDSYVSVEEIPSAQACSANLFLGSAPAAQNITDGDVDYSVASSTGAAAGNRYEEWVWAIPGTSPCIAVRYFIHYGVLENYPAGAIVQFDHAALVAQFDGIRRTLTLGK